MGTSHRILLLGEQLGSSSGLQDTATSSNIVRRVQGTRLGPLRPTQSLLPVVLLQLLDLIGFDYISPFTAVAQSGARFIYIQVDYMTIHLFGDCTPNTTAINTVDIV